MTKLIAVLIIFLAFSSCVSVRKYNEQIEKPHSVKQLQHDVDFLHHKLEKLHPDLYWYITKSELDRKFDSLKSDLREPLTSNAFFMRLSPVVASVRQGHLLLSPLTPKYEPKQTRSFKKYGTNPLARFEFEWMNNHLYVARNYSSSQEIRPGTELISVDRVSPQTILDKYEKVAASDGYNQTLFPRLKAKKFSSFYFLENGLADTVSCVMSYKDTLRTICLKRRPMTDRGPVAKKQKLTKTDLEAKNKLARLKLIQGVDPLTGTFIRELSFLNDSSVALMKIKNFMDGRFSLFYRNSFKTIQKVHPEILILDLRGNTGGRLTDAATLYSYLTNSDFVFIDRTKLISRTSLWHTNYFRGRPLVAQPFLLAFSPFRLLFMARDFLKVKKDSNSNFSFQLKEAKVRHPNPDHFGGKVYVLIDGGTFSASSILSSNLKASKRATFVGEETGGAFNGTVAGQMPFYRLPHSKLKFRFGLMTIRAPVHTEPDGYGIRPDVAITRGLPDLLEQNDPEIKWILENYLDL